MQMSVPGKQSGDIDIPDEFYFMALDFIGDAGNVLNLGCGERFNFERLLKQHKPSVRIVSVDRRDRTNKPVYVDEYVKGNLEEPMSVGRFDVVSFFELIEHLDNTDSLLKTCHANLRDGGTLIFSFPNLSSIYSRIELLLGFQPHILEVSNQAGHFGTGIFGRINGNEPHQAIHHVRGITHKAMKELVQFHGFSIRKIMGASTNKIRIFNHFPSIAPVNIFVCDKQAVSCIAKP